MKQEQFIKEQLRDLKEGLYDDRIDNEEFTIEGFFDIFTASGVWLTTIPANELRKNTMAARFTVATNEALWIY